MDEKVIATGFAVSGGGVVAALTDQGNWQFGVVVLAAILTTLNIAWIMRKLYLSFKR